LIATPGEGNDQREITQVAEAFGLPGERWQILASLGDLHQSCANMSMARQAFTHAAQIVHSLSNQIEDKQSRMIFLSAPRIQMILEGL
jgi:hypothetical protein